jgi:hypothetical protein
MKSIAAIAVAATLLVSAAHAATEDRTPPSLSRATVAGSSVSLRFSEALRGQPGTTAWAVTVNGRAAAQTRFVVAGRTLTARLPEPVYSDDVVRIRYAPSATSGRLRDRSGNRVKRFVALAANRSAPGCTVQLGAVEPGRATEGPTDYEHFIRPRGPLTAVVIHATVQAAATTAPPFPFQPRPPFPSGLDAHGYLAYLDDLSYGKVRVRPLVVPTIVGLPSTLAGYGIPSADPWVGVRALVADAIQRVDSTTDFSEASVVIVVIGGREAVSELAFAVPAGRGIVADGREVRHVVLARGGPADRVRSLLFLFGLPNLLHTGKPTLGQWDITSSNRRSAVPLTAWHRRKLGWLDPSQVRCPGVGTQEITLEPIWRSGGAKLALIPTSATSAVALEVREPLGQDADLCRGGVLAYRVETASSDQPLTQLQPSPPVYSGPCAGAMQQVLDVGPGQTTSFEPAPGLRVELVEKRAEGGYRIRVTRPGTG